MVPLGYQRIRESLSRLLHRHPDLGFSWDVHRTRPTGESGAFKSLTKRTMVQTGNVRHVPSPKQWGEKTISELDSVTCRAHMLRRSPETSSSFALGLASEIKLFFQKSMTSDHQRPRVCLPSFPPSFQPVQRKKCCNLIRKHKSIQEQL